MYRDLIVEKPEWGPLATFICNKREPVYNWFYYKEGFSKNLVLNVLDKFGAGKKHAVLDPFCGSGTTLLACKQMGINSVGLDVLPICVLSSSVKTADYDANSLTEARKDLFSERFRRVHADFPQLFRRAFNRHTLDDIAFFMQRVMDIPDSRTRDFFLLSLISASIKSSYVWKDGSVLKFRKRPVPPFSKFFNRLARRMIKDMGKLHAEPCAASISLCDARRMNLESDSVDIILTSPPYLNNIDYTKIYSIENFFAGSPEPAIRSFIGENEESYFRDMNEVLKEMHRVCRNGARAAIVVGNAYYTQLERHVESDLILSELAEKAGFSVKEILVLNKRFALERRTVKKGVIRESMVVLEK